jgi:hypothetical protein
VIRRSVFPVVLAVVALLALAPAAQGDLLALPLSLPSQLRALVRERTQSASPARSNFESRFAMKVGHGYEMAVIGRGEAVQVEIGRPSSLRQGPPEAPLIGTSEALTFYIARGTVTPRRIAASFGKFGRVDVRFKPAGSPVKSQLRHRCRGADHYTVQRGAFVGSVRFAGEGSYVTAHSHRVQGRVRMPLRLHCAPPRFHRRTASLQRALHPIDLGSHAFLSASWRHGVESTDLFSFAVRKAQLTAAFTEQSLGSVALIHLGLAISKPTVLTVDDALTSATLTPPAPFHGKGTYGAAPDGTKTWTGPLSVAFPGAPRWPLTGEQFAVKVNASF